MWLAVDVGASLCFASTAILWARVVAALDALQTAVAQRSYAPGPALSADTAATQALLAAALQQYADFKTAACATLVFLTLRLFWQFSLQPRLAVMTECLSRAAGDIAHFGFLFVIIMASYCVWGHVVFGRQMDDWRSLGASSFAIVRLCMYDYNLAVSHHDGKGKYGRVRAWPLGCCGERDNPAARALACEFVARDSPDRGALIGYAPAVRTARQPPARQPIFH